MADIPNHAWEHFREFFARAERVGVVPYDLAATLLNRLKASDSQLEVIGLRRQWEWVIPSLGDQQAQSDSQLRGEALCRRLESGNSLSEEGRRSIEAELSRLRTAAKPFEGWREPPGRDTHPRPIPLSVWEDFATVGADSTSHWQDDDEQPEEYQTVDWVAGTLEMVRYIWLPAPGSAGLGFFESTKTEYQAMQIDKHQANDLLRIITGQIQAETLPFSADERHKWIAEQPMMDADAALKKYRTHPRHCRIKRGDFRTEWKVEKNTKRGRPTSKRG